MFKEVIEENINKYGHHITFVIDAVEPRYAYTIGLNGQMGFELVFAGGIYFMKNEVTEIINSIVDQLKNLTTSDEFNLKSYGIFKLSRTHTSWSKLMMLGVFDFYNINTVQAFQIVPDNNHSTLDIPDMSNEWNESSSPVWKWLAKDWEYSVPKDSKVITNIDSLRGHKITEVMRWENDEWEAFAGSGPDIEKKDVRVVSLGTLLSIDPTLKPIINLEIGKGIWRNSTELKWQKWV